MYVQLIKTSDDFKGVLIKFHEGPFHNKSYWIDPIVLFFLLAAQGGTVPLPGKEGHFIEFLNNRDFADVVFHLKSSKEFINDLKEHYKR